MALPNGSDIFVDINAAGLAVSFREFLGYFVKQFWPLVRTQIDKLPLARLDYPLLVLPVFLWAFCALWAFWRAPSRRRALWAAVPAGLLFYSYFHTWVYWVAVIGLLVAYTLVFLRSDRERLVGMAVLIAALAILALPYAVGYALFAGQPGAADFTARLVGVASGREAGLSTLGYDYLFYLALALVIFFRYRRDRVAAAFLLALLAAMVVVWNIQLVLGYSVIPLHWKRIASPVLFIIVCWLAGDAIRHLGVRRPNLRPWISGVIILLAVLVVAKKAANTVSLSRGLQPWVREKYAFRPELPASWEWINANLGPEPKIVASSPMTSAYLTVYTSARPYVAIGWLAPMTTVEIEERFLTAAKLFGVSEGTLSGMLQDTSHIPPPCAEPVCFDQHANFQKAVPQLYASYFKRAAFNRYFFSSDDMPSDYRESLIARYRTLAVDWATVPADYVYYGPHERQLSRIDFRGDRRFTLLYENPLVEVYRIVR